MLKLEASTTFKMKVFETKIMRLLFTGILK